MTLIKSISGIRGTIGGKPGESLSPLDVVKYTAAYGTWVKKESKSNKIVIGRDARISGALVSDLVCNTLISMGFHVVDLGLTTTPTTEVAVEAEGADGGIILTASHNPIQWNALKLLNNKGEFISATDGAEILEIASKDEYEFVDVKKLGNRSEKDYLDYHIDEILKLNLVDVEAIKARKFKVVVDAVNSTGGISVPKLLQKLGVEQIKELNCEPTGRFAHNPEPLPENIREICAEVQNGQYDLGIVVDPDVDRLALVRHDGTPFGEEYTLVAVADYVLSKTPGNTVSNLSSTRALRDVTEKYGNSYFPSAVGEVNVVSKMKEVSAVIGGEGNGANAPYAQVQYACKQKVCLQYSALLFYLHGRPGFRLDLETGRSC